MGLYLLFLTSVLRRTFLRERSDIALYCIVYTEAVFDKSGHRLAVAFLYTLCIIAVLRYRTVVILCSAVIFRYCTVKAVRFALKTLRIHSCKADELFLYVLHYLRIVRAVEPLFRLGMVDCLFVNSKYNITQTAVVLSYIVFDNHIPCRLCRRLRKSPQANPTVYLLSAPCFWFRLSAKSLPKCL